jgi:hypothetical protein
MFYLKLVFMKKSEAGLIILILIIILVLNSCAPAYIPNVVNTPLLTNKGEVQVSVYSGLSGFDPQLSYALTNHIGLMLNGSFANRTDSTDDFHKHQFIELGSGYYRSIGSNGRFEAFGGFGFGNIQAHYENSLWQDNTTVKNFRIFIQPTIGASTDVFDGSFSTRIVANNIYQSSYNSTGFFVEPVVTAKAGFKYVKVVAQLGFSLPVNENNIQYTNQPFMFSIGLQGTFRKFFDR